MAGKIDWKSKYRELRSKYMNAIDVSFKMGVEEGLKNAELENLQQQVADMEQEQAMAQEAEMMGGEVDENGMPIEEMPMEGEEGMSVDEEMGMEDEGGDDMGQSIDELEGFVKSEKVLAKGEKKLDVKSIMKGLHKSEVKSSKKNKGTKQKNIDKMFK